MFNTAFQAPVREPFGGVALPWWNGGYAAYDFTAATYAAAKLDLTGNGRHCTDGTAFPTHTPGIGCVFDAALLQYLDCGFIVYKPWTAIVKFSSYTGNGGNLIGAEDNDGASLTYVSVTPGNFGTGAIVNWGVITFAPIASGTLGYSNRRAFVDGGYIGNLSDDGTGPSTYTLNIGRSNRATPGQYLSSIVSSVYIKDGTLSDSEFSAKSAAMP